MSFDARAIADEQSNQLVGNATAKTIATALSLAFCEAVERTNQ